MGVKRGENLIQRRSRAEAQVAVRLLPRLAAGQGQQWMLFFDE